MKKGVLTLMFLVIAAVAFSQKIYQSGSYGGQSLRPGYTIIQGVLIEKYTNKGFNWFTIVNGNLTYKISVVNASDFNKAKVDSAIVVKECFELSSNKWKRK